MMFNYGLELLNSLVKVRKLNDKIIVLVPFSKFEKKE
jgi:hypothetical protein